MLRILDGLAQQCYVPADYLHAVLAAGWPDNGRDSVPPSLLATALLLQTYDQVSDAEAKARADFDIRWKVAHLSDLNRMVDDVPTRSETAGRGEGRLRVLSSETSAITRLTSQTPGDLELRGVDSGTVAAPGGARCPGDAPADRIATARAGGHKAAIVVDTEPCCPATLPAFPEYRGGPRVAAAGPARPAWELHLSAVTRTIARQLGDVGIDLDRQAALLYRATPGHFDLDDAELDHQNRAVGQYAAQAVRPGRCHCRSGFTAAGLVPQRMNPAFP